LDERTRDFANLAGEVRAWDLVLVRNGDEVSFSEEKKFLFLN
jgi:nuclear pore complex protein Nup62